MQSSVGGRTTAAGGRASPLEQQRLIRVVERLVVVPLGTEQVQVTAGEHPRLLARRGPSRLFDVLPEPFFPGAQQPQFVRNQPGQQQPAVGTERDPEVGIVVLERLGHL